MALYREGGYMGYPISVTPLGPLLLGCRFRPTIPLHKMIKLMMLLHLRSGQQTLTPCIQSVNCMSVCVHKLLVVFAIA